jgi:hypothetical protein
MIDQSTWREGLSEPDYIRTKNKVHNIIIHHSAGSNVDTNYTSTVRNIYIYHTEILGWSDIGYNYLIAANGNIYKGRDPDGFEQDNVLGAHFCGSNTGTMGICMMGTYSDICPSSEAINSLLVLLNWKAGKDSLNPLGNYPHALNSNLPVIAGHRDGCSTECPGECLYQLLDSIRHEVMKAFNACGYVSKIIENTAKYTYHKKAVLCHAGDVIFIQSDGDPIIHLQLFNLSVRKIKLHFEYIAPDRVAFPTDNIPPGIYFIKIYFKDGIYTDKLVILK